MRAQTGQKAGEVDHLVPPGSPSCQVVPESEAGRGGVGGWTGADQAGKAKGLQGLQRWWKLQGHNLM